MTLCSAETCSSAPLASQITVTASRGWRPACERRKGRRRAEGRGRKRRDRGMDERIRRKRGRNGRERMNRQQKYSEGAEERVRGVN